MRIRGGYVGRICRINLSRHSWRSQRLDRGLVYDYIGGRGWGARIIWNETTHSTNPFSGDNRLVIASGPLTGILFPGSGKTSLCAISPETGYYCDSNVGGMFGTELKQAGFDAIVLEGSAKKPTYILLENGQVTFNDATYLWGRGSIETEKLLKKDLSDETLRVASIGPAGENLVKFACVTCDFGRQAGRGGLGAVMGSKRIKAVAVRGTRDIPVADMGRLRAVFEESMRSLLGHKDLKIWQRQGTLINVDWCQENSALPTRNFQSGQYESYRKLNGETMENETKVGNRTCFLCPMSCGQVNMARGGETAGTIVEGPEYETAGMIGSNCALSNMDELIYANYLCDELGIDTISSGGVVAFAMECYEKGFLTGPEADGLDLRFGNSEALFKLLQKIARREGIGNILADGVKEASKKIGKGSEKFAMHVKGMEISAYDHRAAQAMALAYATADVGGHHNRAWAITYDVQVGRDTYTRDKAERVIFLQHVRPMFDLLGTCRLQWVELALDLDFYPRAYRAATGIKMTLRDLLRASERVYNLTRAISVERGLKKTDDWLPDRDFDDPLPSGACTGATLERAKFEQLLHTYYKIRGWTKEGIPSGRKLKELGLNDVANRVNN